jgi:pimeloyl-ACP methyl ester carboxylesterase
MTTKTSAPTSQADLAQHRRRLLAGIPVGERSLDVAGIPTTVLEGGEGPTVALLHGPGESAVNWRWTIPELVRTHRVIAPDLPAHGSSGTGRQPLDAERAVEWLDRLVEQTCDDLPTIVGHVLGGAIAARFAIARPGRLRRLVLVDALGLARFRPSPRFAVSFLRFQARPRPQSFERFMDQCAYDLEHLRRDLGDQWPSFVAYNLGAATSEAGRLFRRAGLPPIPAHELNRIDVPTTLIWGRQDRANRLEIAERASTRHGWPLHVVDRAADDPARDQPEAFLQALRTALAA